jgi:hypothetical protein
MILRLGKQEKNSSHKEKKRVCYQERNKEKEKMNRKKGKREKKKDTSTYYRAFERIYGYARAKQIMVTIEILQHL